MLTGALSLTLLCNSRARDAVNQTAATIRNNTSVRYYVAADSSLHS